MKYPRRLSVVAGIALITSVPVFADRSAHAQAQTLGRHADANLDGALGALTLSSASILDFASNNQLKFAKSGATTRLLQLQPDWLRRVGLDDSRSTHNIELFALASNGPGSQYILPIQVPDEGGDAERGWANTGNSTTPPTMTLAGGTFDTNGISQTPAAPTLSSTSIIDFASAASNNQLKFADSSAITAQTRSVSSDVLQTDNIEHLSPASGGPGAYSSNANGTSFAGPGPGAAPPPARKGPRPLPPSATITWGSAMNISAGNGNADVRNVGTLLDAGAVGAAAVTAPGVGGTVVNGVRFSTLSGPTTGATDFYHKISVTYSSMTTAGSGGTTSTYSTILSGLLYVKDVSATVTLSGLTAGHVYQVQYWAHQPGAPNGAVLSGSPSVTLLGDQPGTSTAGQYAVGTFTASDTSLQFTYSPVPTYAIIDAITLFDITAVPEPSTWIGGAMAAAVLGWSQRRRLRKICALFPG